MIDLRREAAAAAPSIDRDELSADDRAIAIATWRGRMVNEHVSARVFSALVPQLVAAGAPARAIDDVAAMAREELRHGVLCGAVVHALGGAAIAPLPALAAVPLHADAEPLEAVLRNVLSISCLAETVAVALIGAEREHVGPAALRETLQTILADEVGHARFGWRLLDDVGDQLSAAARTRLADYLVPAFRHLREHELANLPLGPTPSAPAQRHGVCDATTARALFFATVERVIIPGLEAHGLAAGRAWAQA